MTSAESEIRPEIAYYYPEPFWPDSQSGWIKSMLLFFDEIAILLPSYMHDRPFRESEYLAGPMHDAGALRIIEPESFVDAQLTERLTEMVVALITEGAFDDLPPDEPFVELSMSRMGYLAVGDLADLVYQELERRGLATPSADEVSIPMHWQVRNTYLILLAQLAREAGERQSLDLHPATGSERVGRALTSFLGLSPMPSRGHVVSMDLDVVGIDLDAVPLDEILEYRRKEGPDHRKYMANVRDFALQASLQNDADRERLLHDRKLELAEEASDLRRRLPKAWTQPKNVGGFTLGVAGAAWSVATMNPVPAILAGLGAALRLLPDQASGSAYSYLFGASRKFPDR